MTSQPAMTFRRGTHVACLCLALAMFPLLIVGAGVTSKEAGMAFPDWPTSDGHLLNPPGWLQQDDTLWEHGHRLIGWAIGGLTLVVVGLTWRSERTTRRIARLLLLGVIVQGVMGGLRVVFVSTGMAMAHGIWGQLCFSIACVTALATSRWWIEGATRHRSKHARMTQRLSLVVMGIVFVQLILGAWLRHFESDTALAAHLVWLVVVCLGIGWLTLWIMGNHESHTVLVRAVQIVAIALVLQLVAGSFAFMVTRMPGYWSSLLIWLVPSAHVGLGALILAGSAIIAAIAFRGLEAVESVPASSQTIPADGSAIA